MRRSATAIVTILLMVLTVACGDDSIETNATEPAATTASSTTEAAPATSTTGVSTTTDPPELPFTGVIASIDQTYKWGEEAGPATPDELPFPLGAVEAHWYRAGDRYAVVYVGLDLDSSGPLCPGTSIEAAEGPLHISNSPTPGAACGWPGFSPAEPPAGTYVCNGVLAYITEIPAGTKGTLYATLEVDPGTGTFYGATGSVEADPDYMADVDPAILTCG